MRVVCCVMYVVCWLVNDVRCASPAFLLNGGRRVMSVVYCVVFAVCCLLLVG